MKDKEELIQHIADRLRSHEENYEPGAWERFAEQEKKKKKIFPLYWIAAACVLVLFGTGIFYFINKNNSSNNQPLLTDNQNNSIPNHDNNNNTGNNPFTGKDSLSTGNNINAVAQNRNPTSSSLQNGQPGNIAYNAAGIYAFGDGNNGHIQTPEPAYTNSLYESILKPSFTGFDTIDKQQNTAINDHVNKSADQDVHTHIVAADSGKLTYFPQDAMDIPQEKTAVDFNRWSVDAVLSPSMSNNSNKVNMGYGVAFGYNVSKKVSVNSGASYIQLTGYSNTSAASSSNVEANVTGVTIPLELRYQISKKIYVNAGASALAVLTNKQQRNFIVPDVQSDAFSAKNGFSLSSSSALNKAVPNANVANVPQSQTGNQNVAGFFNFSLGMKQKLGSNTTFSIEPFVSVPMNGNFGKQNIHLTNAGVRIKFGL